MVTNAELPEGEPTREERAEAIARNVIAGHPQGSTRRIILYTLLGGTLVVLVGLGGWPGLAVGSVAMVVLMLLAMSDSLA